MADIVRLKDRMAGRPARAGNRHVEAEILMFTGVRYEGQADWLRPTDVMAAALSGGPLQLGAPQHGLPQHGVIDPKPC